MGRAGAARGRSRTRRGISAGPVRSLDRASPGPCGLRRRPRRAWSGPAFARLRNGAARGALAAGRDRSGRRADAWTDRRDAAGGACRTGWPGRDGRAGPVPPGGRCPRRPRRPGGAGGPRPRGLPSHSAAITPWPPSPPRSGGRGVAVRPDRCRCPISCRRACPGRRRRRARRGAVRLGCRRRRSHGPGACPVPPDRPAGSPRRSGGGGLAHRVRPPVDQRPEPPSRSRAGLVGPRRIAALDRPAPGVAAPRTGACQLRLPGPGSGAARAPPVRLGPRRRCRPPFPDNRCRAAGRRGLRGAVAGLVGPQAPSRARRVGAEHARRVRRRLRRDAQGGARRLPLVAGRGRERARRGGDRRAGGGQGATGAAARALDRRGPRPAAPRPGVPAPPSRHRHGGRRAGARRCPRPPPAGPGGGAPAPPPAQGPPRPLPLVDVRAPGGVGAVLAGPADRTLRPVEPPATFTARLRPYQSRGLSWLAFLSGLGLGACLADDMGLGKTIQLLALEAADRAAPGTVGPTLLLCPMSLVGNWQREARRFAPGLRVYAHHGPGRRHGEELTAALAGVDLVVTTYGTAVRDVEELAAHEWHRLALDEAQAIKNSQATASRTVRRLTARHRIALTGTPLENRLSELCDHGRAQPGAAGQR